MPETPVAEPLTKWRDFCFREAVTAQERNEDGRFWVGSLTILDLALSLLAEGKAADDVGRAMGVLAATSGGRSEWGRGAAAAASEIAARLGGER